MQLFSFYFRVDYGKLNLLNRKKLYYKVNFCLK